jgi:hypothetical protein
MSSDASLPPKGPGYEALLIIAMYIPLSARVLLLFQRRQTLKRAASDHLLEFAEKREEKP